MRIETDCKWPVGVLGTPGFHLCGKPAVRAPYCEDCRAEHKPFVAIDPALDRKFMASVLRAADR